MDGADPFDLQRFVAAQEPVIDTVRGELAAGAKTGHWMWFVFPQRRGLGRSATARHYGIGSFGEARAYAAHPLLGARLVECCTLLLAHQAKSAQGIFGGVDAHKLRSCLTLFERAAPGEPVFAALLQHFFDGERCAPTLAWLGDAARP
jgi:uncharacterized protein (DUF1810 family)